MSEWISVRDRLPEGRKYFVLTWAVCPLRNGRWDMRGMTPYVTHWMPHGREEEENEQHED